MGKPDNAAQWRKRLMDACETMIANRDPLCAADRDVGDGDHGITMERAFSGARDALSAIEPDIAGDTKIIGAKLMAAGGSIGIVFGTLFSTLSKQLPGDMLDTKTLAEGLEKASEAVQARGKAAPGDRTMLDALVPAIAALHANATEDLTAALTAAADAAEAGAEATKNMLPRMGRARTMGERALGFIDPGALSVSLIFKSLAGRT